MTKLKALARATTKLTSIEYGLVAGLLVVAGIYAAQPGAKPAPAIETASAGPITD